MEPMNSTSYKPLSPKQMSIEEVPLRQNKVVSSPFNI